MDRLLTELQQLRVEIATQSNILDRIELSVALLYQEMRDRRRFQRSGIIPAAED